MVRVWHPDAEVPIWWSLSWPTHLVKFLQAPGEKSGPTGKRWQSSACPPPLLSTAENLRADLGSRLCLFAEIQLHFIDCRESLLSFMDAVHSQIFRWDDEEMSGYPFLCQSQKPLPNRALADTGRLLARQTLVCVSRSSKYLHLIPKGSID